MVDNGNERDEGEIKNESAALKKELEAKNALAEERLNRLKYLQADFDNYRKNFEKEKEQIVKLANEALIRDLLVVIDDFEIALSTINEGKDKEGVKMIYNNLSKILQNRGLRPIEALGRKLDPDLHEAVCKETSGKEDGLILEELQKGYMLKSNVIRTSKVKVAEKKNAGDVNG